METREFDTKEQAWEAAKAFAGVKALVEREAHIFDFGDGWISDLGCRFEVNFNDGRKSECFWVKQKFTEDEVKHRLTQAWITLEGVRSVGAAVAESLLDDSTKGAIGRILAAKEDDANRVIRQFVPAELLK